MLAKLLCWLGIHEWATFSVDGKWFTRCWSCWRVPSE